MTKDIIDAFYDRPDQGNNLIFPVRPPSTLENIDSLSMGAGSKVMRADQQGLWFGSNNFENARTSFGTDGKATFRDNNGVVIIDATGLVSTANFSNANAVTGVAQQFTTTSYVDLLGSSMTFTLPRTAGMLFFVNTNLNLTESAGNTGDGVMFIDIDGVASNERGLFCKSGNNKQHSYGLGYYKVLAAGEHTVKLKAKLEIIYAGAPVFNVNGYYFARVILGT